MRLGWKGFWSQVVAAGLLILTPNAVSVLAQQASAKAAATQQQRPAQQPNLTVDRDPVASPDPDPPAQNATQPPHGIGTGTITRGAGGKYTLRADAYEVRLNASVFDGGGRSIQTLDKDAFQVYEDGVLQTIASFRHEDLPVSLGIVIDSSGSMYDKRVSVERAALDFVKLSNREDEAFVVDFSWEAFIDQDFTNDIDKLQQGRVYQVEWRDGDLRCAGGFGGLPGKECKASEAGAIAGYGRRGQCFEYIA